MSNWASLFLFANYFLVVFSTFAFLNIFFHILSWEKFCKLFLSFFVIILFSACFAYVNDLIFFAFLISILISW